MPSWRSISAFSGSAVEERQEQRADLEPVLVRIRTQNNLRPPQGIRIEGADIPLDEFAIEFHPATDDAEQIDDDRALENTVVGGFEAVQRFTAHRDDCLELRISAEFAGRQGGIALDDIQLPQARVF